MKKRTANTAASIVGFTIDRSSAVPIADQLSRFLRAEILSGRLPSGTRLPTTRELAEQIRCSRGTIQIALENLYAEGYLHARTKAGIQVSERLIDHDSIGCHEGAGFGANISRDISILANNLMARPIDNLVRSSNFSPSLPDMRDFPWDVWARIHRKVWSNPKMEMLRNRDPMGYEPLRVALAAHLRISRGIACEPGQIMITSGASQAIDLLGRFLINPGDEVWCETPGFLEGQNLLSNVGGKLVAVGLDGEGLIVDEGKRRSPGARLAIVSPAHHFPMGHILSLSRRLQLIAWARKAGAWIVEDDYDSEFYSTVPISTLQALGPDRVFYLGTFSKTIFPSIRLGYIICPAGAEQFLAAFRLRLDGHTSIALQAVLTEFISDGYFGVHVRRMRKLYNQRRKNVIDLCNEKLSNWFSVLATSAGMHIVLILHAKGVTDTRISDALKESRIYAPSLSSYFHRDPVQGLVLGFASMTEREASACIMQLRSCMMHLLGQQR